MSEPDKRNGVGAIRDAFNEASSRGRCIAVRMYYCDRNGSLWGDRDHQLLEFDVSGETIKSMPIHCSLGLVGLEAAARQLAEK